MKPTVHREPEFSTSSGQFLSFSPDMQSSPLSSPALFTMAFSGRDSDVTTMTTTATEKPYEEFAEVKAAVMIDRWVD